MELKASYQNFDAGEIARQEFAAYVEQARHILRADLEAAGLRAGGSLKFLDYGCGGGHFVKAAADLGVDACGIDLDEESRRFGRSRGLRIEVGDESDLQARFGDERFNAILMMHTLEHVPQPAKVLGALIERLEPNGILIVRVPDQDSVPSQLKRLLRRFGIKADEWGYVQPPIHLHGYCRQTFKVLAAGHGLELTRVLKTSPLDKRHFPTTERYWQGLGIHRHVYRIGRALRSGGHLVVVFRRPRQRVAA